MLGSLDSGGDGGGSLLLLSVLDLLCLRLQPLPQVLSLELDVPRHAAVLLHHAEATHGGHQGLLLLAECEHLCVGGVVVMDNNPSLGRSVQKQKQCQRDPTSVSSAVMSSRIFLVSERKFSMIGSSSKTTACGAMTPTAAEKGLVFSLVASEKSWALCCSSAKRSLMAPQDAAAFFSQGQMLLSTVEGAEKEVNKNA